ncbi:MAG TPA: hypothetical protein VFW19_10500 [Allosphingosinicella sp.]|nr:hypothetical protein [Allosphingosinicella sp.]
MTRYRLTYRGKPVGEWRATAREARADAVPLKLGSLDDHIEGRVYLEPFAEIEADSTGGDHGAD